MRIDKIEVKPVEESINPELMFEMEIFIRRGYEIPLEITGGVFSDENKKLANIHEFIHEANNIELSAQDQRNEREEKLIIKLIAPLNHKVLDYIETLRTQNKKGDVILTLDIFVKTLISKTSLSHMFMLDGAKLPYQLPEPYEDAKPVVYQYQRDGFSTRQINMWILSGPVFQIGKFSVFEYLLPEYIEGSGSIEERLSGSIDAIKNMEYNMIRGEWTDVIKDSRVVWELLRNQDEIKDLLMGDGYNEQAYTELNESLRHLFKYSSKFHHREDLDKKIMPEIKASKEDAYLTIVQTIDKRNMLVRNKEMQVKR
jgi:hypothetical protein